MRFESQTHPQDDHVDRITDCSTRYGQAPAVCTRVSLAKGRWANGAERRANLEKKDHDPAPMLLRFTPSYPSSHRPYYFSLRRHCVLQVCDTFLLSSKKFLLSSYADLLVFATLSVRPIRLESDLLVSTTFQLLLPVCNVLDIKI